MSAERIIGVDFGTSTSVIRVKRYEDGKPIGEKLETKEVIFGGNGVMVPTLIMKKDDDEKVVYYGNEAQTKKRNFTTYHSFKVDLESVDSVKRAQARKLTEEFFGFMGKQYQAQRDGGHLGNADDKERTIISYPVKWSQETKDFMREAAQKAGFPNVTGMDEAQAAIQAVMVQNAENLSSRGLLQNNTPANILLIDMGAGTTDLVLCRYTLADQPVIEILSTWPKSGDILFGGKEIDTLLQDFFRDKMDEADAQAVFKRIGAEKFKSWKEDSVSPALLRNDTVNDFEALDSCAEMLDVELDEYRLDRSSLEKCLGNYLTQLPTLINGCIENAGVSKEEVDMVIVTGGHSQWYFVKEMLEGRMSQFGEIELTKIKNDPARIIPITRPQETVALGLVYSLIPVRVIEPSPKPEKTYTPDCEFEIGEIGEDCYILKYIGNRSSVSIPPMIGGRKVVEIGKDAFSDNDNLKTVYIPDTVTNIKWGAFSCCRELYMVMAHKNIEYIGHFAFMGCVNLQILDFGMGLCEKKVIKFPKGLKAIGISAFDKHEYIFTSKCIIDKAYLSRKTTLGKDSFSRRPCSISYYND